MLRQTIEGYLDSVPSLTFNTIKTLLIMHAFHSSRHLQSKWMLYFSHASMFKTVQIQKAQPSILKSHKRSKIIETDFYRLYSIMTGSKIVVGSPSKKRHLILKLFSVFYCNFVVKFTWLCHIRVFLLKKLSHY